mmetsp:Transcript_25789/g.71042  ORF Transcript_25789/g.71042 Transcript_25789/m.71042 type:complete len:231 (-) Transcript_25789:837-1529(-)
MELMVCPWPCLKPCEVCATPWHRNRATRPTQIIQTTSTTTLMKRRMIRNWSSSSSSSIPMRKNYGRLTNSATRPPNNGSTKLRAIYQPRRPPPPLTTTTTLTNRDSHATKCSKFTPNGNNSATRNWYSNWHKPCWKNPNGSIATWPRAFRAWIAPSRNNWRAWNNSCNKTKRCWSNYGACSKRPRTSKSSVEHLFETIRVARWILSKRIPRQLVLLLVVVVMAVMVTVTL